MTHRSMTLMSLLGSAVSAMLCTTTAAMAEDACTTWSTAKVQREEGRQWTASVCAKRKDRDALLEIVCAGGKWNVRYLPVVSDSFNPGNALIDFTMTASSGERRLPMGFEGMDGAFTTDLDHRHPVFEMLMSGDQLTISEASGKVADQSYTLKGSRQALTRLKAQCGR